MSTDQVATSAQRAGAEEAKEKTPAKNPEAAEAQGVGQREAKAKIGDPAVGSSDHDADKRPHGTELVAGLLTKAGELMTSEHALASANIALQINNPSLVGQGSGIRRRSVGTLTLSRVRRTLVAPPKLIDAWDVLAERHLLLLNGSAGDGREHLALHLLDAFCDARVRRLNKGFLADLTADDLTRGGGHLWTDQVDESFDQLTAEGLAGRVASCEARLIVIWPRERELPQELVAFTAAAGRPDLDEVIRKHLPNSAAAARLTEPSVAKAVQQLIGARQAADLAALLAQVDLGRKSLKDALAQAEAPIRGTAEWFAELPEREDKAFALALAALDGLSLPTVVAGARLADQLIQQIEDRDGKFRIRPFHRPARLLLAAVEADCEEGVRETAYGQVPIMAVRSRRDGFAREMLDAFWKSYLYLQEVYLDWLDVLARDPDPYVRERVALVAGLLAGHDFDFIRGKLLFGWADDEDSRLRRSAATALRPPALDDKLREIVWELLDQWATRDERPGRPRTSARRLTAAAALGAPVGETDPSRALDMIARRLLPHVSNEPDYQLWSVVATAVVELFSDGGSPTSDVILERVLTWAGGNEVGASNVAIAVLLGLAGKRPEPTPMDERRLAPLLRATGRSPVNVECAAALWRHALGHPKFAVNSLEGLRILAQHVGDSGEGDAEVLALAEAIPLTLRDRRTLIFETRRWLQEESHPPISEQLFQTLSGGESR